MSKKIRVIELKGTVFIHSQNLETRMY